MSERGYLCLVVLCCGSRLRTPPTTPAREKGIKLNIAVSVTVDIGATFAFPTSSGHFMWRHADLRPAPCHPAAHQRRRLRCAEPREGGLLGKGVSCLPASQQLVIREYSYGRFLWKASQEPRIEPISPYSTSVSMKVHTKASCYWSSAARDVLTGCKVRRSLSQSKLLQTSLTGSV